MKTRKWLQQLIVNGIILAIGSVVDSTEIQLNNKDVSNMNTAQQNRQVRAPRTEDIAKICELMSQLGYPIEPEVMQANLQKYESLENYKSWVVEIDGIVVGCMGAVVTHNFHIGDSFLRIIALVVDQSYRKCGIGKSLIEAAEEHARAMNCTYIELTSGAQRTAAHTFYKVLDYSELVEKKIFIKKL